MGKTIIFNQKELLKKLSAIDVAFILDEHNINLNDLKEVINRDEKSHDKVNE